MVVNLGYRSIYFSVQGSTPDKVHSLNDGENDYLVKPRRTGELLLPRLPILLRSQNGISFCFGRIAR